MTFLGPPPPPRAPPTIPRAIVIKKTSASHRIRRPTIFFLHSIKKWTPFVHLSQFFEHNTWITISFTQDQQKYTRYFFLTIITCISVYNSAWILTLRGGQTRNVKIKKLLKDTACSYDVSRSLSSPPAIVTKKILCPTRVRCLAILFSH